MKDYRMEVRFITAPSKTYEVCGNGLSDAISQCWLKLDPTEYPKVIGFTPHRIDACRHELVA